MSFFRRELRETYTTRQPQGAANATVDIDFLYTKGEEKMVRDKLGLTTLINEQLRLLEALGGGENNFNYQANNALGQRYGIDPQNAPPAGPATLLARRIVELLNLDEYVLDAYRRQLTEMVLSGSTIDEARESAFDVANSIRVNKLKKINKMYPENITQKLISDTGKVMKERIKAGELIGN